MKVEFLNRIPLLLANYIEQHGRDDLAWVPDDVMKEAESLLSERRQLSIASTESVDVRVAQIHADCEA